MGFVVQQAPQTPPAHAHAVEAQGSDWDTNAHTLASAVDTAATRTRTRREHEATPLAVVTQLAECRPPKSEAAGSNPADRANHRLTPNERRIWSNNPHGAPLKRQTPQSPTAADVRTTTAVD